MLTKKKPCNILSDGCLCYANEGSFWAFGLLPDGITIKTNLLIRRLEHPLRRGGRQHTSLNHVVNEFINPA